MIVSDTKIPPPGSDFGTPRTPPVDEGFGDVTRHLQRAREKAGLYVSAQLDRARAIVRSIVLFSILGISAGALGLTILATAAVLLCVGIAGGIGELLGGRQWAGDLVFGGAVLGVITIGTYIVVMRILKLARRRTIESYEKRKTGDSTP